MKPITIVLLFFLFFISKEEECIIRIPNKPGTFYNITTKYGYINYHFLNSKLVLVTQKLFEDYTPYIFYKLENMKNLNLLKLPKNTDLHRFVINNNNLELSFEYQERDRHNKFICEIFYKTRYINNMIYSIGKDENNQKYKFFGGTPKNITNKLKKYTFINKKEKISEIQIEFKNQTNFNFIIDLNKEDALLELKEDFYSMICLPEYILNKLKNLFLNEYRVYEYKYEVFRSYYIYNLTQEQKNSFPTIKFKIGNRIFRLNKKNGFNNTAGDSVKGNYLFINKESCKNFIFGLRFLELFDISEFNLDSDTINLYEGKNSNNFIEFGERENKNNYQVIIILFYFLFISIIIILIRIYHKNKNLEYYYLYYDLV